MMKIFLTLLLLSAISGIAFSQGNLEVEITGIRNNKGFIMLQLLDSTEAVVRQARGVIMENKCLLAINDLKPGRYAIRYFHDENLNGVFEKNKLGIPTEGYGFSNNAYGMFGPESFKKWLFGFENDKKISLKIKY